MKFKRDTKYATIAFYSFLVICAVIIFYLSLSEMDSVLSEISEVIMLLKPFIMGLVIAYLLDFILRFYENVVFET